ncbi:MAG: DoxX family protein [Pyrinomonadaceae bacterium]|jgi:putative oxidoreductase|nr:DoxX family protein [Pyrinomonadaceae bacterium]
MNRFLGKYAPYFYAVLRIVTGLMFALHGSQKLFGFPPSSRPAMPLNALMTFGGIIEFVGGLMIAFGLLAGFAAFIASGMMAVAYFMAHAPSGFLPIVNGGELAVLYCFLFLYIAARGSGVWSIDSLIGRTRAEPVADS